MIPRGLAGLAFGIAALALPAAAGGAAKPKLQLDPACYQSGQEGRLTGTGFKPNATWTAKLGDKRSLGSGRTDAQGRIHADFTAPVYHGTAGTRELTLSVSDGRDSAQTTLRMTPLSAGFSPRTGDPSNMRVRWRVLGLTPNRGVYVHYIRPDGTHRRTLRIGTSKAPCGSLKTGPIALFPFRFGFGLWTLQVDASKHFSKATLPRLLIDFDIKKPKTE
ncbi:MAG: hypothetical protein WBC33_12345 [Conexibacter sp.]